MTRLLFTALLCLPLVFIMAPDSLPPAPSATSEPVKDFVPLEGPLPDNATMTTLAERDPILFLDWCLTRHHREVKGYRLVMKKQDRIKGTLLPSEEVKVSFQEKPFSVLFVYDKEPRPAQRLLYVEPGPNEKEKRLLALPNPPAALLGIQTIDPHGKLAMKGTRYPIDEFGLKIGMQRTRGPWIDAHKKKALHVTYLGEKKVAEAGDRLCWVLERFPYAEPEDDGVAKLTMYVDKETWFQVGTTLKDRDGKVIGEYFFRDIEVNPKFDDDTFTRKSLK